MDLTLNDLEQAINYWRRRCPSTGDERSLSGEVNVLAHVYALMIFERARTRALETLDPAAKALIDAWRETGDADGQSSTALPE